MKCIVGLGNPGSTYERTRHNAGFLALDAFASQLGLSWRHNRKQRAYFATGTVENIPLLLAKPLTFMNVSGEAVGHLLRYYNIPFDQLLIVHDDVDLPVGTLAFLAYGSSAGHNGIRSIQTFCNTDQIPRLRIGVGRPSIPQPLEDWVLGPLETGTITAIDQVPDALRDWLHNGITFAMNRWNRRS